MGGKGSKDDDKFDTEYIYDPDDIEELIGHPIPKGCMENKQCRKALENEIDRMREQKEKEVEEELKLLEEQTKEDESHNQNRIFLLNTLTSELTEQGVFSKQQTGHLLNLKDKFIYAHDPKTDKAWWVQLNGYNDFSFSYGDDKSYPAPELALKMGEWASLKIKPDDAGDNYEPPSTTVLEQEIRWGINPIFMYVLIGSAGFCGATILFKLGRVFFSLMF